MQFYLHLSVPGLALGTTCVQCSVSTGGKNGNASKPHGKLCDFTVLSAAALRDRRAWTFSAAAHEGLWAMPCNRQVLEEAVGHPPPHQGEYSWDSPSAMGCRCRRSKVCSVDSGRGHSWLSRTGINGEGRDAGSLHLPGGALNSRRARGRSSPFREEVTLYEWTLPFCVGRPRLPGLQKHPHGICRASCCPRPRSPFLFFGQSRAFYYQEPCVLSLSPLHSSPDTDFRPRALWSQDDTAAPSWALFPRPPLPSPRSPSRWAPFPPRGWGTSEHPAVGLSG